jgi:LmbE family N-acetylglucosaminyl deacetylase
MSNAFADPSMVADTFRSIRESLVVTAHPDDESFGLGAILSNLTDRGARIRVLCFTKGEGSSLGADVGELSRVREAELNAAAEALGLAEVILLGYPDGGLSDIPVRELADRVLAAVGNADTLFVFDEGGVTGHPDHCRATESALVAAREIGIPVLAWTISEAVAASINAELGTSMLGRPSIEIDLTLPVDRTRQRTAIACHRTQSVDNQVLTRRLGLQGDQETLRLLTLAPGR